MRNPKFICFLILLLNATWYQPAGAQSTRTVVAPSSGKGLCSALTPADFKKVGIPVSRLQSANLDNDASAYCIYDSKAGKIEFDIFDPSGDTTEDAKNAQRAALAAIGGKFNPVHLAGADDAQSNSTHPNQGSATIAVRKGRIVFDIGIPAGTKAEQQLQTLAQIVLSRLKQ